MPAADAIAALTAFTDRKGRRKIGAGVVAVVQARHQVDLVPVDRIPRLQGEIFAQRHAEFQIGADRLGTVGEIRAGQRLPTKQVDAAGKALIEKIRFDETKLGAANILAVRDRSLAVAAGSQEIAFGNRHLRHEAVCGRIAAHDRKVAGRLFLDIDVDHDAIRRRTGLVCDLHGFEKAETFDPALGAIDQGAIVGVAFGNIELAPDHILPGARIAANIDALDIGPRAFIQEKDDADGTVLRVAVTARAYRGKRVAVLADFDRHVLDGLFDRVAVVDIAPPHAQHMTKRFRIDRADVGLNLHRAEAILLPLLDREGYDESLDRRIILTNRGDDLDVGVTVAQIEAPEQIAVGFDPIWIVNVGGLQETQEIRRGGLDDFLEAIVRIGVVADKNDGLHAGLFAFSDLKDQVDAIVRPFDDFGGHLDVEAPVAMIHLDDALNVGLHHGARQRTAGF